MNQLSTKIVIGIITYNRNESLRNTFESLCYLKPIDGVEIELVLVDNFKDGFAKSVCDTSKLPFKVNYFFESKKGIPFARNRAVEEAKVLNASMLVFIDDDEEVDYAWLLNMYQAKKQFDADVIVGRVLSVYPAGTPRWVIQTGFFERSRNATGARVEYAATCNVMYDLKVFVDWNLRYDTTKPEIGGSDNLLAREIIHAGGKIFYVDDAVVREEIPLHRTNIVWMKKRMYRFRSNHVQHFLKVNDRLGAVRFTFGMILRSMARIAVSVPKLLMLNKLAQMQCVLAVANILGVLGGWAEIDYKEYAEPR